MVISETRTAYPLLITTTITIKLDIGTRLITFHYVFVCNLICIAKAKLI